MISKVLRLLLFQIKTKAKGEKKDKTNLTQERRTF